MAAIIKACPCGCDGPFMGIRHAAGYLSITCPECGRQVKAFTPQGLADAWNKVAAQVQPHQAYREPHRG